MDRNWVECRNFLEWYDSMSRTVGAPGLFFGDCRS